MTERERLILEGKNIKPMTADEAALATVGNAVNFKAVEVKPDAQTAEYWGTAVSDMQTADTAVAGGKVTGTLKYVASGSLVETWNAHNFLALAFKDFNHADDIKVGINGSASLDEDMVCVFAVESTAKPITVKSNLGGAIFTQELDLSGLTLENA